MAAGAAKMAHQSFGSGRKYGSLPFDGGADMLVDNEMHLKMSKKIAQLTKVIYALNTKHDEHEEIVQLIHKQHGAEVERLTKEMQVRLDEYNSKLSVESDMKNKINSLEANLDEERRKGRELVRNAAGAVSKEAADREETLKQKHKERIEKLSKALRDAEEGFSDQLSRYEAVILNTERSKEEALARLTADHQAETENTLAQQQTLSVDQLQELEKHKTLQEGKLQEANERILALQKEMEKEKAEHDDKLEKARLFYEKELEALKLMKDSDAEGQTAIWKQKHSDVLRELQRAEADRKKKEDELYEKVGELEEEQTKLELTCRLQGEDLMEKDSDLTIFKTKLESSLKDMEAAQKKKRDLDCEVNVLQERLSTQSKDITEKSNRLSEVESENLGHRSTIEHLEGEQRRLANRLNALEADRDSLTSKTMTEAQQQNQQAASLRRELDSVREELASIRGKAERDCVQAEQLLAAELGRAKEEKEREQNELVQAHHASKERELESLREQHSLEVEALRFEFEKKRLELESMFGKEKRSLESLLNEFKEKASKAERELLELRKLMEDREQGLGAATSELTDLRERARSLQEAMDKAAKEADQYRMKISSLETQIQNLKKDQTGLIESHESELKQKLAELHQELDATWLNKLRGEVDLLRGTLSEEHRRDKMTAISHLTEVKDDERAQIQREAGATATRLKETIVRLEEELSRREKDSGELERDLRRAHAEEVESVRRRLEGELDEYRARIAREGEEHDETLKRLVEEEKRKTENELFELKKKHLKEKESQMHAHTMAQDLLRRDLDERKREALNNLTVSHEKSLVEMQTTLAERHREEMDSLAANSRRQVTAAKMEVQRAVELKKGMEKELASQIDELKEEIATKGNHIYALEEEISRLEKQIKELGTEIERKGREVRQVRSDANEKLREREATLVAEKESEINAMKEQFAADAQLMLEEFNKAQDILKVKISTLQLMLEESEERYRNRESRDEDLEMIEQLQAELDQRLQQMNQLLDDKRYYQMELVNRETNFNKVFTAGQQHVGVINPLAKKKKGEKGPTKYTAIATPSGGSGLSIGGSSSSPKLRPIANSPIHDERINPKQVLPPMQTHVKKFVQ